MCITIIELNSIDNYCVLLYEYNYKTRVSTYTWPRSIARIIVESMSREETLRAISNMRKRRSVIRSSLTKLITKVRDLEDSESPLKRDRAQQALIKLDSLEGEFRTLHFHFLDDKEELLNQQEVLDQTEEDIATMRLQLSQIIKSTTTTDPDERELRITTRKLPHLERTLRSIEESVSALDPDKHLIKQYREQLNDTKANLHSAHSDLLSLELRWG